MLGTNFDPFNQRPSQQQQRPIAGVPMGEPNQGNKKQGSKILRFMFNPEIGEDFKNLRQNHTHFLQLISNIFLQTGLIDAAYPGFTDPNKMGLRSLLEEAYRNLRFTKEGIPQILLFFSFVGSLIVIGMSLLFFIISLGATPRSPVALKGYVPPAAISTQDAQKVLHATPMPTPQINRAAPPR